MGIKEETPPGPDLGKRTERASGGVSGGWCFFPDRLSLARPAAFSPPSARRSPLVRHRSVSRSQAPPTGRAACRATSCLICPLQVPDLGGVHILPSKGMKIEKSYRLSGHSAADTGGTYTRSPSTHSLAVSVSFRNTRRVPRIPESRTGAFPAAQLKQGTSWGVRSLGGTFW